MTHETKHRLPWCALLAALTASLANGQEVYFSPHGGCAAALVKAIDSAKTSVDIAAYSITPTPISEALLRASARGCTVRMVIDRRQKNQPTSTAHDLAASGVTTRADMLHTTMHAKLLLIDRTTAWCGSYNWTANAEKRNAEILLQISDKKAVASLSTWFDALFRTSTPFATAPATSPQPHSSINGGTNNATRSRPLHVPRRQGNPRGHPRSKSLERT